MLETNNLAKREPAHVVLDSALDRLPRWIVGVSAAGVLACIVGGQVRFAAGLAVGAAVALLGYWWLCRGIRAAFDAGRDRAPKIVLVKLALRYPLAVGTVLLFNRTEWLPGRAVLVGLFAPLAGVLVESLVLVAQTRRDPWREANAGRPLPSR